MKVVTSIFLVALFENIPVRCLTADLEKKYEASRAKKQRLEEAEEEEEAITKSTPKEQRKVGHCSLLVPLTH